MQNELKIRIVKDSKGDKLSLTSITIEAAESLRIFIESLVELANLYENNSEFKISLKEGSVESSLVFPSQNVDITDDINNIIEGKSIDNAKTKTLKKIQDKIKLNGLSYEVAWIIDNKEKNITNVFKGRNFPYKRLHSNGNSEVVFLKGFLYESGGKKTVNIHIEDCGQEYTIDCTNDEAIKVNTSLFKEIFISAIKTVKGKDIVFYKLVDYYSDKVEYENMSNFYDSIVYNDGLEKFDLLHNKIYNLIIDDKTQELLKIVKVFNTDFTEKGIIRTILMSLKPVRQKEFFPAIDALYKSLSENLRLRSYNKTI